MTIPSLRPLGFFLLTILGLSLFAPDTRAELVWRPGSGWSTEGGVLSGLVGEDAETALHLMNVAREAEERGQVRTALRNYDRVSKRYVNSVYGPEALYRMGHLYLGRQQYTKAFTSFQTIISRYPNTPRFNEVVGEQYRIASALLDGARNRIWGIIPGFKSRERAIGYFELVIRNAPYSDYAPLALMNIARAHQALNNQYEGIDALDRMINFYPDSLLTPDAYLKLAETHASLVDGPHYDQLSTREAVTHFEDFIILFPSDTNVAAAERGLDEMKTVLAESKMLIGDFYFYRRSNYHAARVFYNEAITAYPDSAIAARAREEIAKVDAAEADRAALASTGDAQSGRKRFWLF